MTQYLINLNGEFKLKYLAKEALKPIYCSEKEQNFNRVENKLRLEKGMEIIEGKDYQALCSDFNDINISNLSKILTIIT